MTKFHNKEYFKDARRGLRKHSTEAENMLWNAIRNKKLGFKFRRQHSIGNFIVDFYCPEERLIVEVDGQIHQFSKENYQNRDMYFKD